MRTLPFDVSRCAGRMDLEADGRICEHRDRCQRYLAFIEWDKEAGIPNYQSIPVTMAVTDCEHMIEVME